MLDKKDLIEIKKIVDSSIDKSETKMSDKMEFLIEKSELKLVRKIEESENNIINKMNREISDLADINRAAISRTDQIDYRLSIVERKLGIKN